MPTSFSGSSYSLILTFLTNRGTPQSDCPFNQIKAVAHVTCVCVCTYIYIPQSSSCVVFLPLCFLTLISAPLGSFSPLEIFLPLWFPGSCQSRKICTPTLWFRKINDFTSFVLKSGYSWLLSCPRIFLCFWFLWGKSGYSWLLSCSCFFSGYSWLLGCPWFLVIS